MSVESGKWSVTHHTVSPPGRFLCGTVNDFVAEVGKAYERATENKEEADAMAKKVIGLCNFLLRKCLYNTKERANVGLVETCENVAAGLV